jgi:hypothetical protein
MSAYLFLPELDLHVCICTRPLTRESWQMKHLQQQKAKFRLAELEERLKRLQLLETRLKLSRGKPLDYNVDFFDSPAHRAHTAAVGEDDSFESGDIFNLPGALHQSPPNHPTARRPSTFSQGSSRGLYSRPPASQAGSDPGGEGFLTSKEMMRQMVRDSLRQHLAAEDKTLTPSHESGFPSHILSRATCLL